MAPDSFGGIGLVIGPIGPLWLNVTRDPQHADPKQRGMDRGFILLPLVSATGFALLLLRGTSYMALYMALWLAIHLGVVMSALRQIRPKV